MQYVSWRTSTSFAAVPQPKDTDELICPPPLNSNTCEDKAALIEARPRLSRIKCSVAPRNPFVKMEDSMFPTTVNRVSSHTAEEFNQRINEQTRENISIHGSAGPQAIAERLKELDQEWDIERALEANAATVALVGLGLGAFVNRRFYALPAVVAGFLLQHATQGWCPPVPVLRRLGFRTQPEIERERYALEVMRGDFSGIDASNAHDEQAASAAYAAVRR